MSKALTGKWQWNDVINPMDAGDRHMQHGLRVKSGFTSNGQKFDSIRFTYDETWKLEYGTGSSFVTTGAGYPEDDYATPFKQYRVIDFGTGSEADDDSDGTFIKWFLSNVTRYGTVAEKLVQIAENEKAVYQSGFDEGYDEGYNKGYDEGLDADAYEKGKQAEYDAFWDACQVNGTRTNYRTAFAWLSWRDANFKPKYDIKPINAYSMFTNTRISDIWGCLERAGVVLDTSEATDMTYICSEQNYCSRIGVLDFRKATSSTGAFYYANAVETIDKIIVNENNVYTNWFGGCKIIKNITFEGVIGNNLNISGCTALTIASIENIINHLSDTSTGKTLTLSLTAVDNAYGWYLPDGSFVGGSYSGPWGSLEASKPNWTIDLV